MALYRPPSEELIYPLPMDDHINCNVDGVPNIVVEIVKHLKTEVDSEQTDTRRLFQAEPINDGQYKKVIEIFKKDLDPAKTISKLLKSKYLDLNNILATILKRLSQRHGR